MAEATNTQMQTYCDTRIRVRAEQLRSLVNAMSDDKALLGDEYQRATTNPPGLGKWTDARLDGPPHLLQSGYSALDAPSNPDDLLNYNAFVTALLNIVNGTSVANGSTAAADAATVQANYPVLMRACVRPTS